MTFGCCNPVTHARAARYDPTRTTTLRKQFERDLAKRFRRIKKAIRELLVDQDGLDLRVNYAFPRSVDKTTAFMEWLRQQQAANILELRPGVPMSRAAEAAWTSTYVRSAYSRGMAGSAARLRKEGVEVADDWVVQAFTRPFHADRVGLAYTRVFEELQGITAEMDRQISRVLADGIVRGDGARDIARAINDRVQRIGITRARMLARTEVIRAYGEAALNTYEEAGVMGVGVQAEFLTAQDDAVCEECESLAQRGPYSLEQARGMIPVHPNCRCAYVPVVEEANRVRLR